MFKVILIKQLTNEEDGEGVALNWEVCRDEGSKEEREEEVWERGGYLIVVGWVAVSWVVVGWEGKIEEEVVSEAGGWPQWSKGGEDTSRRGEMMIQ